MKAEAGKPSKTPAASRGPWQLYWVAYNTALESDVLSLLTALGIKAYTRWDEVKRSGHSGPHLNDDVWPAVNSLYMFAGPAAWERRLSERVAQLRRQFPGEGIKLIVQSCKRVY